MRGLEVAILTRVYVNSQGNHFIGIALTWRDDAGKALKRDYFEASSFGFDRPRKDKRGHPTMLEAKHLPKYAWRAIAQALKDLPPDRQWDFYEVNRDGDERHEGGAEALRYHERGQFDHLLQWAINKFEGYGKGKGEA